LGYCPDDISGPIVCLDFNINGFGGAKKFCAFGLCKSFLDSVAFFALIIVPSDVPA
tara:strand:- start:266 stop:433 length:168 start_codon:yes stop_codon:yes gene_type:complete